MPRYLWQILICWLIAADIRVSAAPPSWWSNDVAATRILQGNGVADNYAPANLGQLKWVAAQAKKHLDAELSAIGGAGPTINDLVASFTPFGGHTPESRAANYAPANLGQLKAVAKPFYDRLISIGYDTQQNLIDHGATGWSFEYPWNPATAVAENYAPANLGQLKWVFSFSVDGYDTDYIDADEDGMFDWWEVTNGLNPYDDDAFADEDGDGWANWDEHYWGSDPQDYYNGYLPELTLISGNNQSGSSNSFLADALIVRVRDAWGDPLSNAPVTYSSATCQMALAVNGEVGSSIVVRTDASGYAEIFTKLPATKFTHHVSATASSGSASKSVVFTLNNLDGAQLVMTPSGINVLQDLESRTTRSVTVTNVSAEAIEYSISSPESTGSPVGYFWKSSDGSANDDRPEYVWNSIAETGTKIDEVSNHDDTVIEDPIPIGFKFPFYGVEYSEVWVTSNGYVTLGHGSDDTGSNNYSLPSDGMPANLIAAFFDDLDTRFSGDIYYKLESNTFTIQYENVRRYGQGTATFSFQVVLERSGVITFYYKDQGMNGTVNGATVGIQDNSVTRRGLAITHNSSGPPIHGGLAFRIRPWLMSAPTSGTITAGQSTTVNLSMLSGGQELSSTVGLKFADSAGDALAQSFPITMTVSTDFDGDGLLNTLEAIKGTDPYKKDTNGDGINDKQSLALGINALNLDHDGDGVLNAVELAMGANLFSNDSDGDGIPDGDDFFPLDPDQTGPPEPDPGDTIPPVVTVQSPAGATPLP